MRHFCLGSDELALSLVECIVKKLTGKECIHGERQGGRERDQNAALNILRLGLKSSG